MSCGLPRDDFTGTRGPNVFAKVASAGPEMRCACACHLPISPTVEEKG